MQLWDIMHHTSTSTFELYTYIREFEPGEAHHSLFFWACPPYAIFVGLPFPVFIRLGLPGFPSF